MQLHEVSLCVYILIVENQGVVEVNTDLSIKVFLKWKKGYEPAVFSKVLDRDKWTNNS